MKTPNSIRRPRGAARPSLLLTFFALVSFSGARAGEVIHWGSWGSPYFDQSSLTNVVGISVRDFASFVLRADGTVIKVPYDEWIWQTIPTGLSNIVDLTPGGKLAIRADGVLVDLDTAAPVFPHLTNVVAAASGGNHHLALLADGSVFAWGDNSAGQTNVPPGLSNVIAVAAGRLHSLAVLANGTVVGWGTNNYGQARPPPGLSNVLAVAAGRYHSLALRADGTLAAWGSGTDGLNTVPAGLSNVVAIFAAPRNSVVLRADRTLEVWGNELGGVSLPPYSYPTNVLHLAVASSHAVALLDGLPDAAPPLFIGSPRFIGTVGYPLRHRLVAKFSPRGFGAENLPPGLELDSETGLLHGTPEAAGEFHFTVTATNAAGTAHRSLTLFVNLPAPALLSHGLVQAPLGNEFRFQLVSATPVEWLAAEGLPPGLELNPVTGEITGAAMVEGSYPVTLLASNRYGLGTGALTIRVSPVIGWGNNANGQLDVPSGLGNVIAIATGPAHSLALREDGSVVTWGATVSTPSKVSNVVAVAAGNAHNLALRDDGSLVSWGTAPVPLYVRSNIVAIGAGAGVSVVLLSDGSLVANRPSPIPPGLSNVLAFSVYGGHGLALRAGGFVAEWPSDFLQPPPGLTNVVALAAGGWHSLALRADGTVVSWGKLWDSTRNRYADFYPPPPGLTNIVAIAAGHLHCLALRADGTVVAWGDNSQGQTNVPTGLRNVVAIAAAGHHSLALVDHRGDFAPPRFGALPGLVATADHSFHARVPVLGKVSGVGAEGLPEGLNLDPATGVIEGVPRAAGTYRVTLTATNATGVSRRDLTLVINTAPPAIQSRGQLEALLGTPVSLQILADYAPDWFGAQGLPPGLRLDAATGRITGWLIRPGTYRADLAARNRHGFGYGALVFQVRAIAGWGENSSGQTQTPISLSNAVALAAGGLHALALRMDGTVSAWGYPGGPSSGLNDVLAISAGAAQSLALRADGRVVGWGQSYWDGTRWVSPAAPPAALRNAVAIASGSEHHLALLANGQVFGWGVNSHGQLNAPPEATNLVAIAAGGNQSLALRADGTVLRWGEFSEVPEGLTDLVALAAGQRHVLALRRDGRVVAWGVNSHGQVRTPPDLADVVAVAAGAYHSLALKADGTIVGWGDNSQGQISIPPELPGVRGIAAAQNYSLALLGTTPVLFRDGAVKPGSTVCLAAPAMVGQPVPVQWYFNGTRLAGATGPLLELAAVDFEHLGTYRAMVELPHATLTNASITLRFEPGLHLWAEPTQWVRTRNQPAEARLRVVNAGPDSAEQVELRGTVETTFTLEAAAATRGEVRGDAEQFSVHVDELAAGETVEVRLRLRATTAGEGMLQFELLRGPETADTASMAFVVLDTLPALGVERTETGLVLSWPATASGFVLEETTSLNPASWTRSLGFPQGGGDRYQLPVSTQGERNFFRLAR